MSRHRIRPAGEASTSGAPETEDDAALLSTLGVTAANPEDIERTLLAEVEEKAREGRVRLDDEDDGGEGDDGEGGEDDPHSNLRRRLHKQVVALDREIDAVADGVYGDGKQVLEEEEEEEEEVEESVKKSASLHRALADDRLKSLLRKRRQLKGQLKALDVEDDNALKSLVENITPVLKIKEKGTKQEEEEEEVMVPSNAGKKNLGSANAKKKVVRIVEDNNDFDAALDYAATGFTETERDRLIRTGMMTPFDQIKGFERKVQRVPMVAPRAAANNPDELLAKKSLSNLTSSFAAIAKSRPTSKLLDASELPKQEPPTREFRRLQRPLKLRPEPEEGQPNVRKKILRRTKRPQPEKKWRRTHDSSSDEDHQEDPEGDDSWSEELEGQPKKKRIRKSRTNGDEHEEGSAEEISGEEDVVLDGGLKIPARIYDKLFDYQKTGVKWMWELHCQKAGGIMGDEMGLGKTIQVIAFLAGLHNSGLYFPSIVICPVTLLRQWKREIRIWYPAFKVEILHDSAVVSPQKSSKKKAKSKHQDLDEEDSDETTDGSESEDEEEKEKIVAVKKEDRWNALIARSIQSSSGILLTTYEQLRVVREKLLDVNWGYAVLDEGHRIRNPDAGITLVCKQLQTVHRIIMTGAPIQNKLTELWSLFDFVFPGKLGVLPVFQAQFSLPIAIGGYANATPLQVTTAYRCAVVLRDLIMPYLLRRMKSDVEAHLPKKTEHVLFCSLVDEQRAAYRAFLASSEVEQIFDGNRNSLYGIDILRKICNHPDLLEREYNSGHPDYGSPERSGKLKVLAQVLDQWKTQGHKVLLFAQTQQMLNIIENHVIAKGYVYRRMDGNTPVKQRMSLIDEFNEGDHVFIFILTTKVGGLGTNLVGANRVVIFDPDWNPSTDMQARERAWRIGQLREVVVYRLITRGTIEEKVYHRQIYKHFLTNKILRDPQQRRFFKARDMRDLFTLQEDSNIKTETSTLFAETGGELQLQGGNQDTVAADGRKEGQKDKKRDKSLDPETSRQKEKAVAPEDGEGQEEESRILKSLFESNGIHSAMDHDAILGVHETEKVKIDREASQVAERAAIALQQSRRLRSAESVAVPTWTGRSGTAGAPVSTQRRFGSTTNTRLIASSTMSQSQARTGQNGAHPPAMGSIAGSAAGTAFSSADLLARVQERKAGISGVASRSTEVRVSSSSVIAESRVEVRRPSSGSGSNSNSRQIQSVQPEVLIRQLCTFFQKEGGSVSSAHVVEHFRDRVSNHDLSLFRQLLKQIAILEKRPHESKWVLKPEYQEQQ